MPRWLTHLFHTSADRNVLVGKDGFLYYDLTINDYTRINQMSDENIDIVCQRLKAVQDEMEQAGIAFFFISPPSKVTIYPEYLPDRYPEPDSPSVMTRLYNAMG